LQLLQFRVNVDRFGLESRDSIRKQAKNPLLKWCSVTLIPRFTVSARDNNSNDNVLNLSNRRQQRIFQCDEYGLEQCPIGIHTTHGQYQVRVELLLTSVQLLAIEYMQLITWSQRPDHSTCYLGCGILKLTLQLQLSNTQFNLLVSQLDNGAAASCTVHIVPDSMVWHLLRSRLYARRPRRELWFVWHNQLRFWCCWEI